MQIMLSLLLALGAILLLVFGLIRVLHDLLGRGPYEPPAIADDSEWSLRNSDAANSDLDGADATSGAERLGMSSRGDQEGSLT
jgi:hypothetical protein